MSSSSILPVVLAGGSGARLWPLSRQLHPKQFLALCGLDKASFSRIPADSVDYAVLVRCPLDTHERFPLKMTVLVGPGGLQLEERGRGEGTQPRLVRRPWGWYDSISFLVTLVKTTSSGSRTPTAAATRPAPRPERPGRESPALAAVPHAGAAKVSHES